MVTPTYADVQTMFDALQTKLQEIQTTRSAFRQLIDEVKTNLVGQAIPQFNQDGSKQLDSNGDQVYVYVNPVDWNGQVISNALFTTKFNTIQTKCTALLNQNNP